jgi:salicylate 5-hydroxylase small subunit
VSLDPALQREVEELYNDYARALDDGPLDAWPALFTDPCTYLIVPRSNFEAGLPLAIMRCESRGMLEDRVRSVQETIVFEPRYLRHHVTNISGHAHEDGTLEVQANYSVVEVLPEELPRILSVGRYLDVIERGPDEALKFSEKRVVYDSELVPNSIVYPL